MWYKDAQTETRGFTYAVPKYWDKNMEYIFFAYAPYDVNATDDPSEKDSKTVYFDRTKGTITIKDIPSIQNISKSETIDDQDEDENDAAENLVFNDTITMNATDYLMATYVTEQQLRAHNTSTTPTGTNQNYVGSDPAKEEYTMQEQTVGFTFGHMLSKLKIILKAKSAYSGVQYIKVSNMSINNMPASSETKTVFTQTSPSSPAGTYNKSSYNSELIVIGTNGTSTAPLYILKNGSFISATETVNPPTSQPQTFNYYVAPNKPVEDSETPDVVEGKYLLNINYTIHYVDGIEENVTRTGIDLSSKLVELVQNNQYSLTVIIDLNQIYFTVDAVTGWADETSKEIEVNK